MALELVVGDAPVLAGAVFRKLALAVARERAAAGLEVPGQKRQVRPLQCTAAPPTPSPGRKEPSWRIGSAVSAALFLNVMVSRERSCISSCRPT